MTTDQLGGTTYTFPNITAFLANQPSGIQYAGDISAPSVVQQRRHRDRGTRASSTTSPSRRTSGTLSSNLTLNYGLRYDYYTPLKVQRQPDRQVQPRHRHDRPEHDAAPRHEEGQLPAARVDDLCAGPHGVARRLRRLRRSRPGRRPDPADRERPRQHDAQHRPAAGIPDRSGRAGRQLHQQPEQPQLPAARLRAATTAIPEKVYQYTASVQREFGGGFTATAAYVGSQGRNLFLRSVANQITQVVTNSNPANAALVIREFSIVQRGRERQRHRRAEPVRRGRLQDQRRPRRTTTR